MDFKENIKISQMSDLVAFVWSDSANIYVKTFQDSIWYETLELPLNGLTHIDHSLNCAVYKNQHIWVAFDAINNGNKDVYALSLPTSFVIDTLMTPVKQSVEDKTTPGDFALFQNYPNPFNSSTTIKYQLPVATDVKLEIYNLLGQRIRTMVDQSQQLGSYSIIWDGTDDFNQPVSSGVYLYQLKTQNIIRTNKLIMLR
ncbi:MAG: T9SS type A sorting domain-containing protein [candidate division KSB1 bacterium]|nr:T9SS type A sorting domain-containing protein [candidate division KSB1 bacterium]